MLAFCLVIIFSGFLFLFGCAIYNGISDNHKETFTKQQNKEQPTIDQHTESITFSVKTSYSSYYEDVRQKTEGVLQPFSANAWNGYVSPSGGFINYARYQVVGINPKTNRKNKRVYEEPTESWAILRAKQNGLIEPFEVVAIPSAEPTERQLDYAKDLGITVPEGACKHDVSALISRVTNEDEQPADESIAMVANRFKIKLSRYSGNKAILEAASNLPKNEYKEFKDELKALGIKTPTAN